MGAARSGTSSLWQYLKGNEEVFMPVDELYKEPCYFSFNESMGLKNYLNIFVAANEDQKIVGEASTAYLTDPSSAGKIFEFNANAKIIIMLRNPAERAYSLYNWMVQDGYEYAGSFEKALMLENQRINKKIPNYFEPQYYYNYLYFNSGLYYEQVQRYIDLFGNNVLVIKFDDFKSDLYRSYKDICLFLSIKPNHLDLEVHNISIDVYSPKLQFLLRKLNDFSVKVKMKYLSRKITTKNERDNSLKLGLKNKKPKKMKIATKELLIKKYEQNIKLLSHLTTLNFDEWLTI